MKGYSYVISAVLRVVWSVVEMMKNLNIFLLSSWITSWSLSWKIFCLKMSFLSLNYFIQ